MFSLEGLSVSFFKGILETRSVRHFCIKRHLFDFTMLIELIMVWYISLCLLVLCYACSQVVMHFCKDWFGLAGGGAGVGVICFSCQHVVGQVPSKWSESESFFHKWVKIMWFRQTNACRPLNTTARIGSDFSPLWMLLWCVNIYVFQIEKPAVSV